MVVYALWAAGGLDAALQDTVTRLRPRPPSPSPVMPRPATGSRPDLGTVGTEADLLGEASGSAHRSTVRLPSGSGATRRPADVAAPAGHAPQPAPGHAADADVASSQPKPRASATEETDSARRTRTPTPRSGTFAAAKVPDLILRKARLSRTRLKEAGSLKPEAVEILDELVTRLDDMDGQSPFEQLGVSLDATTVDIKKAYMQLVKRLHPDRLASIGLEELAEPADALFKRITQAHQTLSDSGNLEEARKIYSGASTPEDPEEARRAIEAEVNFQKGEVFFRKGDLPQAESYFRMAVDGNPQEGEHLAMLAWTQYQATPKANRASRREEIQMLVIRALELSPRCARAHYFLGKLYLESGLQDSAMESFRRATNIRDNYIEAMRELRLLTMRREREGAPKRRSTILDMLSLKRRKK
jgi:curved DNA-binding protein CbpA